MFHVTSFIPSMYTYSPALLAPGTHQCTVGFWPSPLGMLSESVGITLPFCTFTSAAGLFNKPRLRISPAFGALSRVVSASRLR